MSSILAFSPSSNPVTLPGRPSLASPSASPASDDRPDNGDQISLSQAAQVELYSPGDFDLRDDVETGSKAVKLSAAFAPALKAVGTKAGFLGAAVSIPDDAIKAGELVGQARRTGSAGDINRAAGGVVYAAGTTAKGVKAGLDTAVVVAKMGQKRRATAAAVSAFRGAAPTTSKRVANAAGRAAAAHAVADARPNRAAQAAVKAGRASAKTGLVEATGAATRRAATATLRRGGTAAGKAAVGSLARSTAVKTAGRLAGRFVPGLNVGIAALDTAAFVSTMADPKASWAKKGLRGLTAGASIVAATNIPFLSQGASIVSGLSSVADAFVKR